MEHSKTWYKFVANVINNDLRSLFNKYKKPTENIIKIPTEDFQVVLVLYYSKIIDKKIFKELLEKLFVHYIIESEKKVQEEK